MLNFSNFKNLRRKIGVLGDWQGYQKSWLNRVRSDQEQERLLDAGCGQGQVRDFFKANHANIDYYGIDLTVGDASWDFKVSAVADLHEIPFKDASFDKIICTTVLEHVVNPIKVMGEFARVLRPNGRLHLMVPMAWPLHQEPHDHFRFTKHTLIEFSKRYGLEVEALESIGGFFSVLRYLWGMDVIGKHNNTLMRFLAKLWRPIMRVLDKILVAPICYFLDKLDHDKNLTVGYFVSYRKTGEQKNMNNADDPYQCPKCSAATWKRNDTSWTCQNCGSEYTVENMTPKLVQNPSYQMANKY